MNILFHIHAYPPDYLAGAETMAHRFAKYLVSVGHDVKVLHPETKRDGVFEGVKVLSFNKENQDWKNSYNKEWEWADVVFTHLVYTHYCLNKARFHKKKVIHIIHNSFGDYLLKLRTKNNFLVYNSEFVKNNLDYNHKGILVKPPVDYREYEKVKPKGEYITLVNLNENKGGEQFIQIAKRLPQYKFLGVEGGYYEQIKDTKVRNIKYVGQQKDMKAIYASSRLVLMLSEYESYGQVAVEAISCGVPVISTPTLGLKESLGMNGIFIARDDIDSWVNKIVELMDNQEKWFEESEKARLRAKDLDPLKQLKELNNFVEYVGKQRYEED